MGPLLLIYIYIYIHLHVGTVDFSTDSSGTLSKNVMGEEIPTRWQKLKLMTYMTTVYVDPL